MLLKWKNYSEAISQSKHFLLNLFCQKTPRSENGGIWYSKYLKKQLFQCCLQKSLLQIQGNFDYRTTTFNDTHQRGFFFKPLQNYRRRFILPCESHSLSTTNLFNCSSHYKLFCPAVFVLLWCLAISFIFRDLWDSQICRKNLFLCVFGSKPLLIVLSSLLNRLKELQKVPKQTKFG